MFSSERAETLPLEILQLCRAQCEVKAARRDRETSLDTYRGRSEEIYAQKARQKNAIQRVRFLNVFEDLTREAHSAKGSEGPDTSELLSSLHKLGKKCSLAHSGRLSQVIRRCRHQFTRTSSRSSVRFASARGAGSQFPRGNYSAANPKNTTCCKVGSFSSVTGTRIEKHCSAIAPLIAILLMG